MPDCLTPPASSLQPASIHEPRSMGNLGRTPRAGQLRLTLRRRTDLRATDHRPALIFPLSRDRSARGEECVTAYSSIPQYVAVHVSGLGCSPRPIKQQAARCGCGLSHWHYLALRLMGVSRSQSERLYRGWVRGRCDWLASSLLERDAYDRHAEYWLRAGDGTGAHRRAGERCGANGLRDRHRRDDRHRACDRNRRG